MRLVAKENDNPISPSELEDIKDRISQGVSIMNFFGHFSTSESGFDINLDNPVNWDNENKYPLLIANSCYNGIYSTMRPLILRALCLRPMLV